MSSIKLLTFVLLSLVGISNIFAQNNIASEVKIVVIDAGHGGKDPGALGSKSKEKTIALAIALKLGNYISKNIPDVKVIYTRTTDNFLELKQRADIANDNNADVFISIHCNANEKKDVYGSSTYVTGITKDPVIGLFRKRRMERRILTTPTLLRSAMLPKQVV